MLQVRTRDRVEEEEVGGFIEVVGIVVITEVATFAIEVTSAAMRTVIKINSHTRGGITQTLSHMGNRNNRVGTRQSQVGNHPRKELESP